MWVVVWSVWSGVLGEGGCVNERCEQGRSLSDVGQTLPHTAAAQMPTKHKPEIESAAMITDAGDCGVIGTRAGGHKNMLVLHTTTHFGAMVVGWAGPVCIA